MDIGHDIQFWQHDSTISKFISFVFVFVVNVPTHFYPQ